MRPALAAFWLRALLAGLAVAGAVPLAAPPALAASPPAAAKVPPATAKSPKPGLQIPAKEFRARVRSVALVPLFFARIPAEASVLKARYDSLLVAGLKGARIRAIPGSIWTDEKRSVTDSAGIAVDKATGRPDLKKADAIVAETKRRVAQRHGGFDAIVYPSVRRTEAGWFLHLDVVSARGALLYQADGEILRVAPVGKAPAQLPGYDTFKTDPERDARSVNGALDPLAKALAAK